jgi:metaxin
MYLTRNFDLYTLPMYIGSQSSSTFVQLLSGWELKTAARDELLKVTPKIDEHALYLEAEEAFSAIENLIMRKEKLASGGKPTMLEASLFAYLFLIIELPDASPDRRLADIAIKHSRLHAWAVDYNRDHFGNLQRPSLYSQD